MVSVPAAPLVIFPTNGSLVCGATGATSGIFSVGTGEGSSAPERSTDRGTLTSADLSLAIEAIVSLAGCSSLRGLRGRLGATAVASDLTDASGDCGGASEISRDGTGGSPAALVGDSICSVPPADRSGRGASL